MLLDTPWPTFIDGQQTCSRLPQHPICQTKCEQPLCREVLESTGPHLCPHRLTFYQSKVGEFRVIVYGVIGEDRSVLPKDPFFKKHSKRRSVSLSKFQEWVNRLLKVESTLKSIEDRILSTVLNPLHDPIRFAKQLAETSSRMIKKIGDGSIEDGFKSASPEQKTIYKAAGMLVEAFDTVNIYFNPAAAAFGRKNVTDVYRLVDKIVKTIAGGEVPTKRHTH